MNKKIYSIIRTLAMFAVPFSPAFFFGWRAFATIQELTGGIVWLSVPVGIVTAVGLEVVGIFAGHTSIEFHKSHDKRWMLSALIMCVYVVIGTAELWDNAIGRVMFLISALVYLLVAMSYQLEDRHGYEAKENAHKRRQSELDKASERRQMELDRQAKRDAVERRDELKATLKLAEIANPTKSASQDSQTAAQTARFYECVCGKVYESPNAYSGHKRHCKVSANGAGK